MSGQLQLNRVMRLNDWAKQSGATPEEVEAVKSRVAPIGSDNLGDKYQETTLDRASELVREEQLHGDSSAVLRSEAERCSVVVATQMAKMVEEWRRQGQLQEQQIGHIATMTSMVAQAVPSLASSAEFMMVSEVAAALGCGPENVRRLLKAGTIPERLLVAATDRKHAHRKFHRAETEKWINKHLAGKKKK